MRDPAERGARSSRRPGRRSTGGLPQGPRRRGLGWLPTRRPRALALRALLVLGLLSPAAAQAQGPASSAILKIFGGREAKIEVNLNKPLLGLLAESLRGQDGDFAELLDELRWVQVRVFDLDPAAPPEGLAARAKTVLSGLTAKGWDTIVRIRDGDERIDILVLTQDETAGGLLAFFMDAESAGFVSIDGRFDPAQLGRLASRLSLGPLSKIELDGAREGAQEGERHETQKP